ncbi:DUF2867 domain-containing protein [Propionibacteriaceae bacterium Y1700]|uniref:DUF2867 domain-containing protein n=1 Tax=Microlunatus sp. Y1700 TaxID=3418487 RepID=UPI003DA6FA3D
MRNVHERVIEAPAGEVGALLDNLGSDQDELWPSVAWDPLELDRPLAAGADGGHGPIRYRCDRHEPGRLVRFVLDGEKTGISGWHALTVEDLGDGRCRVRHELEVEPAGALMAAVLPTVIIPIHDAMLEDLLDNAERAVTGSVRTPARWTPWVRMLRAVLGEGVDDVPVPAEARLLAPYVEGADLLDAWRGKRDRNASNDPQDWADAIFRDAPPMVKALLALRNALVGLVGIERSDSSAFATLERSDDEVLLGEDQSHLDFRCSVLVSGRAVTVSTAAHPHNRRGRLYLAVIKVAHPMIVRSMLARAVTKQRSVLGVSRGARTRSRLARTGR